MSTVYRLIFEIAVSAFFFVEKEAEKMPVAIAKPDFR